MTGGNALSAFVQTIQVLFHQDDDREDDDGGGDDHDDDVHGNDHDDQGDDHDDDVTIGHAFIGLVF